MAEIRSRSSRSRSIAFSDTFVPFGELKRLFDVVSAEGFTDAATVHVDVYKGTPGEGSETRFTISEDG